MELMTAEIVSPPVRRHARAPLAVRRPLSAGPAAEPSAQGTARSAAALLGAELEELTRDELIAFVPEPWLFDRMVPPSLFARMIRKGLTVRVLHGPGRAGEPAPFPALARLGTAAPTTFALPYPVIVRDRSVLYMPHPDPRHPMAGRLLPQPHVVAARSLAVAFDLAWASAAGQAQAPEPPGQVNAEQREILQVLSNGVTDDHAAAQLHMSRRTFARRVASLMENLGATSRFQVGVQAVRRGLI
jgi:DNA-binding CsgD family transcriptional regulator